MDLDNTLCRTEGSDYISAIPIVERISHINQLKALGHHITIWTARGGRSGKDHRELTARQLQEWGVQHDELLMGKPDYDVYYDDKSFHIDSIFPVPSITTKTQKLSSEIVKKGWGKEIIFVNNDEYCGKILCFDKGKRFSMHYHLLKKETWYVNKGRFILVWVETATGTTHTEYLEVGDVITNERGQPHQLIALEEGEILEVSSKHFDEDSYRMWKGD